MIAALFVEKTGIYSTFDNVDVWDVERDARNYAGPWPVVAHPPCTRWCRLAGLVEARWGYKRGDDGVGFVGGWTCYVEQGRYGHLAKKATWLYACGVELPALLWGHVADRDVKATVSWCGNRTWANQDRPRIGKKAASATPIAFANVLVDMARSARPLRKAAND